MGIAGLVAMAEWPSNAWAFVAPDARMSRVAAVWRKS